MAECQNALSQTLDRVPVECAVQAIAEVVNGSVVEWVALLIAVWIGAASLRRIELRQDFDHVLQQLKSLEAVVCDVWLGGAFSSADGAKSASALQMHAIDRLSLLVNRLTNQVGSTQKLNDGVIDLYDAATLNIESEILLPIEYRRQRCARILNQVHEIVQQIDLQLSKPINRVRPF